MKRKLFIILILLLINNNAFARFGGYLKADTAVKVKIGPFVDVGDGFTPQTDIGDPDGNNDLDGTDESYLIKHDAADNGAIQLNSTGQGLTWDQIDNMDGWYNLSLTATETDTEGMLTIVIQDDSDCLPVCMDFMVMNDNSYEAFFENAAELLTVDVTQIQGDATADGGDGLLDVNIKEVGDDDITDNGDGRLEVNVEEVGDSAINETVAGHLDVNVTYWEDDAVPATADGIPDVDTIQWDDAAITDADATPDVDVDTIEGVDATDQLDTAASTVTVTALAANVITSASINDGAISDVDVDDDVMVDVKTIETGDATDALDTAANTVTVTSIGAGVITGAAIATDAVDADALDTDAVTEIWAKAMSDIAAGAPSATASVLTAINYLYEAWRNKTVTDGTNSEVVIYKDDGATKLVESDISDDGTDFTRGEMGAPD